MGKRILILFYIAGIFCIQSCEPGKTRNENDPVVQAIEENELVMARGVMMELLEDLDIDFAIKAASGGLVEVKAGKLAHQKSQNQWVRIFAAEMVQDRTTVNGELGIIAVVKNIALPAAPGEDKLKDIGGLNSYLGADFDKQFMNMMVNEHQSAVDLFEDAAAEAADARIKAFASKTLPTLRRHLEEAKILREALN